MNATPAKMNPFPGLRPFTQEEDYLFFGREEQTLELLQRLGGNRFVAVVGSSGSGKSSLVRCGLLSELLGGRMLEAGAAWEIAVTHPGGNPLALLTEALLDADLYDREAEHARENLLATLSRSHFGLVEAVKQASLAEGTNFLLVVDQFEEIFRFHEAGQTQQEVANEFVSLLLEAAAQKEVPIYVVLTMRSDFIGECGQFEGLAEMVNRGEFLIPRLTREQYKRVIEGPIKVAGGQIAPRLLQRLLNDLGQQADQLPCLQHALMRTWDVWSGQGDTAAIDLDDYQRVGKMSQALSLHADEIYQSLAGDRQPELCQGIFQALTVEESNSRGIRRPQRLGRLCQILEVPAEELLPIIDAYRRSGVTFLMPAPEVELTEQTIIDISHESLMRVWTRLRQWVEEETQAAGIYHRLSESADLHYRGKAGLYRDPELGIALAWRESKHPNAAWAERYRPGFATAIGFLEASQQASVAEEQSREAAHQRELQQAQQLAEAQQLRLEQQQRAARNLRKLMAGVAVVAVIAAVACVFALVARHEAGKLAELAAQEAKNARKNEQRAEQSQQETKEALNQVQSSLTKAEQAEQVARGAEETGRKLLYTTDLRLAPFVWRDDRTTAQQLRVLLAKHIPEDRMKEEGGRMKSAQGDDSSFILPASSFAKSDLRGFEWHYYQHLLERSAAVFTGHDDSIAGAAFTSNGQLVTLDQNGQVRRWNLGSQDEDESRRRDLPGGASAQARALSPDGRLAALASSGKVHLIDTSTGKETFQFDSTDVATRHLIFTLDSDRLVIVDAKIRWYDAASGDVIASLDQRFDRVESLALSADGLTLAVAGHSPTGSLFSIFRLDATAKKVTPLAKDAQFGGTMSASALSPEGGMIAVGAKLAGSVYLFDTATGRPFAAHGSMHASPVSAMAFSGDGAKLATADTEGTIKIWEGVQKLHSKSTARLTLKGHRKGITTVDFSHDGKQLASGSADNTARVWDLDNAGAAIRPLEDFANGGSFGARFSPDGQLIADANPRSGAVRLWDAGTGRLVRELSPGDKGQVFSVAFSPTDQRLLAVGYGGQAEVSYVALWDIDTGTELARLPGANDLPDFLKSATNSAIGALAFSPDGKHLVAGFGSKNMLMGLSSPSPLKVWEVATRRLIRRLSGHTGYCIALDFSRDGTLLASGSRDGTAIVWSTDSWKAMKTLENPEPDSVFGRSGLKGMVEAVAFSPDGKVLALASREGTVQLWDVADGKLLDMLKGHSSGVESVAFSPDGRTLASGSGDQTVRLWNVETRRELMQLDPGNVNLGQVQSLAFSHDGQHLLAGGGNTAIWSTTPLVWNDPDRAAENLRRLLQSQADFQSRVRMFSENLRLHAALEKLDSSDVRVAAALAATQANWHASRQAWPEAAQAFDRLMAADPRTPEAWLRTPGLLRLATALLHQNRPRDAAALLQGGAKRRTADGLPAAVDKLALGIMNSTADGSARITELLRGSPAARSSLRPDDVILKVNDTELTRATLSKLAELLTGEAGTKVRLTVRRSGSEEPVVIGLAWEKFVNDGATGELLHPLLAAINDRLAREPRHPGLLELRAEFAGQWSGSEAQAADYTAAIEALAGQAAAADIQRLYGRRGHAYVALRQWPQAVDDYARVVMKGSTDEDLLANEALAQAEVRLVPTAWTVPKPVKATSERGATLSILPDDSILAGGENPLNDKYRIDLTVGTGIDLAAVRLEALTHSSLPGNGPGRLASGSFALTSWNVTALPPDGKEPIPVPFDKVLDDRPSAVFPIAIGHWNISGSGGRSWNAIWSMSNPVSLAAGTTLTFEMQFKEWQGVGENLGHFRLSLSSDPTAFDRESRRTAATKPTDPWQRLAAAYRLHGDDEAIDQLIHRHPKSAGLIGDLFIQGKDEDKDWARAVEIYSRGITTETTDVDLLSKRARAYEELKNWEAAAADWSRAATGSPVGARLLAEFAQRAAAADQVPLATAQFEKVQTLYERELKSDPDDDLVAGDLAQLLLDRPKPGSDAHWMVLQPTETKSEAGATLTKLEDNSVLASGLNPAKDTYTITTASGLRTITGLRLEALPDPSLPSSGPGRAPNFVLTELEISSPAGPAEISRALATYEQRDTTGSFLAENATDHNHDTGWAIYPRIGQAHTAYFQLKTPVDLGQSDSLKVVLHFKSKFGTHNLGRFRLAVCGDTAGLEGEVTRSAALKLTDPWPKLAAAYAMHGRYDEALQFFGKALQRADGYEFRKPILELAAKFENLLSLLAQRKPDDEQLQLALARKLAESGQQRLADKKPAEALPELQKSREILGRLRTELQWTVLTPTDLKSNGSEKLAVEPDGSIFVTGPNSQRAVYKLKFRTDLPALTAIRLETIPDPRLPQSGAGRYGNGNFHLAEFKAAVESGQADSKPIPIVFGSTMADFPKVGYLSANSIDGNPRTYWDTHPKMQEVHWAVFASKSPARLDGGTLSITLDEGISSWGQHGLGRFRISVTNAAEALNWAALRQDLKESEAVDLNVALAKAQAQQGRVNEAVDAFAEALDLAADRAAKASIVTAAAPLAGVLEKLAERAQGNAQFQAELARLFAEQGQTTLADATRTKARALFESQLAGEPENSSLATDLASLLLPPGDHWVVLKPVEMTAESGTRLELQNDGSVFVQQQKPASIDTYSLVLQSDLKGIRGLRLEVLADSRLPGGGPGWGGGNFVLNELTLHAAPSESLDQAKSIALRNPSADFSQQDWHVRGTVDGNTGSGWAIGPQGNKDHTAVFELAEAIGDGRPLRLTVRLNHRHYDPTHTLGRFRLSVSADPVTLDREQKRLAAMQITDPWARLAAAYHLIGDQPAIARIVKHHPAAAAGVGDLFAAELDWERAIAEYGKAITLDATDADLFASRAEAYEKQQLWEQAIADWGRTDELVADKNKRYGNYPSLIRRAILYDRIGQNDKALADYSRALGISNGLDALIWRSGYFSQRGQWRQAADDYRQLWTRRQSDWYIEWTYSRERALLNLLAGDVEGYRQAAAELLTRTAGNVEAEPSRWLLYMFIGAPDMVTDQNRDRLTAAADKLDAWWKPRMQAALLLRGRQFQQATGLFEQNPDGPAFQFLAAMAHGELKNSTRASELLALGNAWLQQQRDNDPGRSVPRGVHWHDWAIILKLQREATRRLAGPQLAELDTRLTAEPANSAALVARASLLTRLGLDEEALADLEKVSPPPTDSADFIGLRGCVLAELNRADEALADLNRAVELQSTDALVYAARGKILRDRGATDLARSDLEKSLKIEPLEKAAGLLADLLLAETEVLVPTSKQAPVTWRYSTKKPANEWTEPDFDDAGWQVGAAPFGSADARQARTAWSTPDIWLRRSFEYAEGRESEALYLLRVLCDDDAEVFLNGKPLARRGGHTDLKYVTLELEQIVGDLFVPGNNTLAVHCLNYSGLGYIDVGLSAVSDGSFALAKRRFAATKNADPWARLAAAYYLGANQPALGKLLERHPAAAAGIGDLYAADNHWEQAVTEYTRAITAEPSHARIFAARAEAYEKLERWELAAADWGSVDLHASDKKVRYGNPSFPALERRFSIHGRLQQWDKQVLDCNELLKPERLGNEPWILIKRGETYDQLRQWDQARADYDQAVKADSHPDRASFQFYRARHFAAQGRWKQAAEDLQQAWEKPTEFIKAWWCLRDAALIFAVAGDVENYRRTAAECLAKLSAADSNPDGNKWTVLALALYPEMITAENRARLLELAGKIDSWWQPRLTAAISFRSRDEQPAAELFDAHGGGPQFAFLAAMVHENLGHHDRAQQLLDEGNSWIREQRAKDPGAGVPRPNIWQDWATAVALQFEASDLILGSVVGAPRQLILQGQAAQAVQAYATALAEAADKDSRSRILEELVLTTGSNGAAAGRLLIALDYRRRKESDKALRAYRQAAAAIQPVGGSAFVTELARGTLREFGVDGPEAEALLAAVAGEPPAAFNEAIQNQPDQAAGYLARGEWYGNRGLWRKAADDYAVAYRLQPEVMTGLKLGIVLAGIGEAERYREHCRQLLGRVADTSDTLEAERTLKACCLLGPSPVGNPTQLARLAEVGVLGDNSQPLFVWLDLARALYEFRIGKFDAAVATSVANRQRIKAVGGEAPAVAAVIAIQALALHRSGDAPGARSSLAEAQQMIDEKFLLFVGGELEGSWDNWLAAHLLYREAQALLETKPAKPRK